MSVVRNSLRTFLSVLVLLCAFHGVMFVLGLAVFLAHNQTPPTPDVVFKIYMMRVGVDAGLLVLGHYLLRTSRAATRIAYGAMGAAATGVGYAFALSRGLMISPVPEGSYLTAAILPMIVGMIAATIYAQFAGRDAIEARGSDRVEAPSHRDAQRVTFDGPVQVRTSFIAIVIASFIPAAIAGLVFFPFVTLMYGHIWEGHFLAYDWSQRVSEMALPVYLVMVVLIITALPAAIVVRITHAVARAVNRLNGLDYALIGAIVSGIGAALLLVVVQAYALIPYAVISGAIMGAVYRKFAGLEPLALPEAVLATDRAALVGQDDAARRTRAVIMDG